MMWALYYFLLDPLLCIPERVPTPTTGHTGRLKLGGLPREVPACARWGSQRCEWASCQIGCRASSCSMWKYKGSNHSKASDKRPTRKEDWGRQCQQHGEVHSTTTNNGRTWVQHFPPKSTRAKKGSGMV